MGRSSEVPKIRRSSVRPYVERDGPRNDPLEVERCHGLFWKHRLPKRTERRVQINFKELAAPREIVVERCKLWSKRYRRVDYHSSSENLRISIGGVQVASYDSTKTLLLYYVEEDNIKKIIFFSFCFFIIFLLSYTLQRRLLTTWRSHFYYSVLLSILLLLSHTTSSHIGNLLNLLWALPSIDFTA